jgi:hypothetical protein
MDMRSLTGDVRDVLSSTFRIITISVDMGLAVLSIVFVACGRLVQSEVVKTARVIFPPAPFPLPCAGASCLLKLFQLSHFPFAFAHPILATLLYIA